MLPRGVLLAAALLAPRTAWGGLLSGQGVAILDQTGASRTTFSNSEQITMQVQVYNGAGSSNRTVFTFTIVSPTGSTVFTHTGNAVPGTVGNAASQVSGVPISQFYTSPGVYTFNAQASLDAQTITQSATFVVSSPNILLVYPPNGSRSLTDNPLTFRWTSSGATQYRVTVADNPSLYNARFQQTTSQGESFMTYPQNPSDPLQRLTAGTVYYWQVEGLDANGNVIGKSQIPFSFSLQTVSLTKDIAVTAVEVLGAPDNTGAIPFRVTIKDQGSTSEGNFPLRFSVGGLPAPNTPVTVDPMNPGDVRQYNFNVQLPAGQSQSLAIACVELFDDIAINNCKSLSVTAQAPSSTGSVAGIFAPAAPLTKDQIWQAIQQLLQAQGYDLSGYNLTAMEGSMTADELAALLDALRQGQAQVSLSGPPLGLPAAPPVAAAPLPSSQPPAPASAAAPTPTAPKDLTGQEWAGMTAPPAAKRFIGAVRDASSFSRLWSRLREDQAPMIDFTQYSVAGVVASPNDRADHVEIELVQPQPGKTVIRYRLIVHDRMVGVLGPEIAAKRKRVPYVLRVIPRADGDVQFQKSEVFNEGNDTDR